MSENTPKRTFTISKTYGRKVVIDYQTWLFNTTMSHDVEVSSPKELDQEADKLFKRVRKLTNDDIKKVKGEWNED